MGKKDIVTKEFMADNRIFADAFNYLIYGGEQVIDPDRLRPLDTALTAVPYGAGGPDVPVQKFRDELKYLNLMEDGSAIYLLLGIENQSDVNYAMPVKDMVYDALQYAAQVEKTAKRHRAEKSHRTKANNSGEYLTGFYKSDRLLPVITLVVFFSAEKWDGPKCIHDMLSVTDPQILSLIPDYRINLIAPEEMAPGDFDRLVTNLREVLLFIRNSKDKDRLRALVAEDAGFRSVERNAVRVINTVTRSGLMFEEEEGETNMDMCKAIADMREDERNAGRAEGREEGKTECRIEDILTLLNELCGEVSKELREIIASEKDAETLKRYLKLAASVDSVEEFMNRMS